MDVSRSDNFKINFKINFQICSLSRFSYIEGWEGGCVNVSRFDDFKISL